ncbi:hypothetical protein [Photobacterium sp. J15]|uniref:hypothetical protein n=1 Tax=Photobacterium sp. J15 TaxID=265901 RepID=UPI0007E311C4|nr:hypothetical protein [Photobacterium sp. J15]
MTTFYRTDSFNPSKLWLLHRDQHGHFTLEQQVNRRTTGVHKRVTLMWALSATSTQSLNEWNKA